MTKEQDNQIAEQVMGWSLYQDHIPNEPLFWVNNHLQFQFNEDDFHPTTDANDDCIVLEHIRKTWGEHKLWLFDGFVIGQWSERKPFTDKETLYREYEKGDYGKAALKVTEFDGCYSAVSGEPKVSGGTIKVSDGEKTVRVLEEIPVTKGSGCVFADLGVEKPK
jgi:hypothetical protein